MFGLSESDAGALAKVLVLRELDRDGCREVVARAMWTGIVEPGDRVAGLIVSALGAAAALDLIVEERSAREVVEALKAASLGSDDPFDAAGVRVHGQTLGSNDEETRERDVAKAIARWKPRLMPHSSLSVLRRAESVGARLLIPPTAADTPSGSLTTWPTGLDDLGHHAPIALWMRGAEDSVRGMGNSIALVGARAATGYGEHVAMEASAGLVDRGYAIVSGAAYGIDGMAHRAALASHGTTVAFLAGGVDRFYPSGHDALLARIVESGAVLSELPCGEPPTKWRFLQRNRLIAAASNATVVLEAGWRSGSLNTAGHAAALGRPLGAVPGPVTSAASAGCHRLIREFEAVCVTNADEMAELAPLDGARYDVGHRGAVELSGLDLPPGVPNDSGSATRSAASGDRPSLQVRVLDALSTRAARTSADVAARCGLAASTVQGILGVLELENKVTERGGGWVAR
jgi:DNA processing protein